MRVLQINAYGNYSTGKIAQGISLECKRAGIENLFLFGRNACTDPNINSKKVANDTSCRIHFLMGRVFDRAGFHSSANTRRIIRIIREYKPDVVQLHVLHGYYCNVISLFRFLSKNKIPIVWTFHDSWSYTGHCAYYLSSRCEKWKDQCEHCKEKMTYPRSFIFSQSHRNFLEKRKAFTSVQNMTIVSNCNWLKNEISQSFFHNYKIVTIPNGVDQSIFKYSSESRKKLFACSDNLIVLAVANKWDIRKGLNDVIDVYKKLDSKKFTFVIVGLTQSDKNLYNYQIPDDFIVVDRTSDQNELAAYYSASDYFLCLSHEDTFPTTIIESISCGTPVITYDVGGCSEAIIEGINGKVFLEHDIISIADYISHSPEFNRKACLESSKKYDSKECFKRYVELYLDLNKSKHF